jgi:hypothetical protein
MRRQEATVMPTAAMADARRHRSLFALIPAIHQRTVANHGMIRAI